MIDLDIPSNSAKLPMEVARRDLAAAARGRGDALARKPLAAIVEGQ
jgi:hypothetical protein